MKSEEIKALLSDLLPAVDFNSDFLFAELDSLGITTILFALAGKYDILLGPEDITPRNFKNIEAVVNLKARLSSSLFRCQTRWR